MQEVVTRSVEMSALAPASAPALERTRLRTPHTSRLANADVVGLWRETLHILSTHSAPILTYAFLGLVGANFLGLLVGGVLLTQSYTRAGGYAAFVNITAPQLIIQGVVGSFTAVFARGAVTWIALHAGDERRTTARDVFCLTLKRWPALVAQSLIYGALISIGLAGLTLLLRELRLDVTNIGRINTNFNDMTRAVAIRAMGSMVPDPGSPFAELDNYVRSGLNRSAYYAWYFYRNATLDVPVEYWLIGLAGAGLMVVADTLFRLRTVMAMRAQGPGRFAGLADSARLGWRYFGHIALRAWLLRLVLVLAGTLFTVAPMTFVQGVFVPIYARQIGSFWPYPASSLLFALGGSLVSVIFTAFEVVYDTRIFATVANRRVHFDSAIR